jgi:hypothetical protein
MKKCTLVIASISIFLLFSLNAVAQQEKGDKELGLSGSLMFTHSSPVFGTFTAQGNLGYYATQKDMVGFVFGPTVAFGDGETIGSFLYGGEYQRLFGQSNAKIWPFLGAQIGASTVWATGMGTSTVAQLSPEVGVKIYTSPRTAFQIEYQIPIILNGGYGGFGDRSRSEFSFGFRHLFGKGK